MKFGALIVTYNADASILEQNIRSIIGQVDNVLVVDNGSDNINAIVELAKKYSLDLIKNKENLGIASALNLGMSFYDSNGYQWVLTLDQDSKCPDKMIDSYLNYIDGDYIGIICPQINYVGYIGKNKKNKNTENPYEIVDACMTSASFTNVNAWKTVGKFSEELFIDYVDNDFCKKLEIAGYKIIRVNGVQLEHRLGNSRNIKIMFVFNHLYGEHSPLRSYYIIRNNLFYIKKYKGYINVCKEYAKLLYIIVEILLLSKQKCKHFKYIIQGLLDYKNNKMGIYSK